MTDHIRLVLRVPQQVSRRDRLRQPRARTASVQTDIVTVLPSHAPELLRFIRTGNRRPSPGRADIVGNRVVPADQPTRALLTAHGRRSPIRSSAFTKRLVMDLLFTLLLCSPYPAIGLHTARAVLREARKRLQSQGPSPSRLRARTWLFATAMVIAWPAIEVIPPTARLATSAIAHVRHRASSTNQSA